MTWFLFWNFSNRCYKFYNNGFRGLKIKIWAVVWETCVNTAVPSAGIFRGESKTLSGPFWGQKFSRPSQNNFEACKYFPEPLYSNISGEPLRRHQTGDLDFRCSASWVFNERKNNFSNRCYKIYNNGLKNFKKYVISQKWIPLWEGQLFLKMPNFFPGKSFIETVHPLTKVKLSVCQPICLPVCQFVSRSDCQFVIPTNKLTNRPTDKLTNWQTNRLTNW